MTSQNKVAVIIPLYNAAEFIEKTIRSILDQTFTDFHIYVIDDISTDGSDAIVKKLAVGNKKITYHRMPRQGGCPAPTKNEGVRLATAEYVAFCDHDDWWKAEKLARQVEFLDNHPEIQILGCNVEIVDTDRNKSLGNFWSDPARVNPDTIRQLVLDGPVLASTSCMIARRPYLLEHPFDERLLGSDEYDLSLRAILDDPRQVAILPEVLAYWRWHEGSLSHSKTAAERALQDETLFAAKILARSDLNEAEKSQIKARLRMVTRRAGNAAIDEMRIDEAKIRYQQAAGQGDRTSRIMLILIKNAPALASALAGIKRGYSQTHPVFR
ncbi:MAG TPA: glycosyltransferase family A protein [Candidatus Saccharimonadales bacterium]|nr:glycosyltransferase family A protein [Candidatus Saccharimonadales bacterium]